MKMRSFRLRIALLSALLAGSALAGFGVISWLLIYQAKLAHLDSEIQNELQKESTFPQPIQHWENYEKTLPTFFRTAFNSSIVLLVVDNNKIIYQSESWPKDLNGVEFLAKLPSVNYRLPPPPPPAFSLFKPPPHLDREPEQEPPRNNPLLPHLMPPPPDAIYRRKLPPGPLREIHTKDINQISIISTQRTNSGNWRIGTVKSPFVAIAIAVNCHQLEGEMATLRNIFFLAIPLVLILVAFGAWILSGSALKPLRQVTKTIQQVTAKGLDQRISISAGDLEFIELIQVFNQMMERLDRSFQQASRFSADAAHELKTPLAILQGELERTLQQAPPGSELQQNLSNLLDEVRHLGIIIRKLLLLSLADAGQMRLHLAQVNISKILTELAEDIEMLAPHLDIQLEILAKIYIQADKDLLIQVLQNLISNAIKYNLPEGWIKISTKRNPKNLIITVSNSSQDIPEGDRQRIFDRFYRADPSRNRHIEGLGLGLSLSREIARSHGGDLILNSSTVGYTAFTLTLPAITHKVI